MNWKRLLALAAAALLGAACMFGWFYRLEIRKYEAYQRHMAQQPETYPLAVFDPEEFHRWRLTDAEGREATIARADNRLAVVSFWASWCAPCIAEFEGFQKLRERAPANVDFYFVTDDPIASVEAMAGRFELPFYTYGSDSALPAYLRAGVLPRTYMMRGGRIVYERQSSALWDSDEAAALVSRLAAEVPPQQGAP